MLRYILLMLILDLVVHAENVDVYSYSDSKKVYRIKRQNHIPAESKPEPQIIEPNNLNKNQDPHNHEKTITVQPSKNEHTNATNNTVTIFNKTDTDMHIFPVSPRGKDHLGAAMRSFWVFLGLSVIVVIYFTFRAFKTRPGAPAPTTVRKYGVVGRRGDLEMLPLPLNDEDDDDTLFDAAQQHNNK